MCTKYWLIALNGELILPKNSVSWLTDWHNMTSAVLTNINSVDWEVKFQMEIKLKSLYWILVLGVFINFWQF